MSHIPKIIKIKAYAKTFLPWLMMRITGENRYLPDIKWSTKSWTHNVFRLYELLFWRRDDGVRTESVAIHERGQTIYICYTWESVLALFEHFVREFFKVFEYVPIRVVQPQLAGLGGTPMTPYRFAIAFDASGNVAAETTNSSSWTHVCTGSNLVMGFGSYIDSTAGSDVVTGFTYNSVAGTRILYQNDYGPNNSQTIYYLINPATGSNTAGMTLSSSKFHSAHSISWSGAKQSGQPDSSASDAGTASAGATYNMTTTVVAANSALYAASRFPDGHTVGTNTTLVVNDLGQTFRSTANVSSGSQSLEFTSMSGKRVFGWVIASIAPVATGPANEKTWNGLAIASISTQHGLAIASNKTYNGLT